MSETTPSAKGAFFAPTMWSKVLRGRDGDSQESLEALNLIFTRYREPILRHIQHEQRCNFEAAEELTQKFLAQCVRREFLKSADPTRGRFRTFIKSCIANFLCDEHRSATTEQHGGGVTPASLDETDEDGRPLHEAPAQETEPGLDLDRAWAKNILTRALRQLEAECAGARASRLFGALRGSLDAPEDSLPLAELGRQLGMQESAVKVAAHRLRKRLGELVKEEVRQTVGSHEDWREELRELLELIGR